MKTEKLSLSTFLIALAHILPQIKTTQSVPFLPNAYHETPTAVKNGLGNLHRMENYYSNQVSVHPSVDK
jgi:hypothetical protein